MCKKQQDRFVRPDIRRNGLPKRDECCFKADGQPLQGESSDGGDRKLSEASQEDQVRSRRHRRTGDD